MSRTMTSAGLIACGVTLAALLATILLEPISQASADPPRRRHGRARVRRDDPVSVRYAKMRRRWHAPPTDRERRAYAGSGGTALALRPVHGGPPGNLTPGGPGEPLFGDDDLAVARAAFAQRDATMPHDVHPRLLALLHRAARHFRVPFVRIVSGHRPGRATSRHAQGRAADVVLPGVGDERLAIYFRQQGFVGVGLYPVSGFVHVDVRGRSYFWVDRSGPGRATRRRQVLPLLGRSIDRRARQRGEEPVPDESFDEQESDAESEEASEGSAGAAPAVPSPAATPRPVTP